MNDSQFLHRVLTVPEIQDLAQQRVLVALSGGADSVALLRVLLEAGCRCHAAHCNFHLRGEESMRDERFVRDLCQRLGVPLSIKDFDVPAWQQEHGGSVEMACRELRYDWFEQERLRCGCDLIAVAHHADDQVETFFLNLMRGAGVKGLSGMSRKNGHIWRPLLGVGRQDVLDYLASIGQDFVTDSTNSSIDYNRNRLRNIVIPVITQQFPQAQDHILAAMDNLKRDHELITSHVAEVLPDERHIDIDRLCCHPQAASILFHRLRHLGFNFEQCAQAIEAAVNGRSGKQLIGKGFSLFVNRTSLDVEPLAAGESVEIEIDLRTDVVSPVHVMVSHNNAPFSPAMCDGKAKVAFHKSLLDCNCVVLRHWSRGDRIKPYGMKGSKLVSDLFADFKLDHAAKQAAWLLEADGEILWVLGYRASALYPIDSGSQDYLLLTYIGH